MTRFARSGQSNKKKLPSATPWTELQQQQGGHSEQSSSKHRSGDKLHKTRKTQASGSNSRVKTESSFNKVAGKSPGSGTVVNHMSAGTELPSQNSEFRNSEFRRLRRQDERTQSLVCFHCRKKGHAMADCPQGRTDVEHGVGICYKCGSTEHRLGQCRARVNPTKGELPYAKCYVCGQMGHLSKGCPDNPKGLYPEGGSCRECGSVEHYRRDCPVLLNRERFTEEIVLDTVTNNPNASAETDSVQIIYTQNKKRTPKIVTF